MEGRSDNLDNKGQGVEGVVKNIDFRLDIIYGQPRTSHNFREKSHLNYEAKSTVVI